MIKKLKAIFMDKNYIKFAVYLIMTSFILLLLYLFVFNLKDVLSFFKKMISEIFISLSPLIYGLILAYFFSPLVNVIDKKLLSRLSSFNMNNSPTLAGHILRKRRNISIAASFLLVAIIFVVILFTLYSMIVGQFTIEKIDNITSHVVNYFSKYNNVVSSLSEKLESLNLFSDKGNPFQSALDWLSDGVLADIGNSIRSWISKISGNLVNLVLGFVIAVYLLKDQDFFLNLWDKTLDVLLQPHAESQFREILSDIHKILSNFFRGQLIDGLIIGILSSITLFIIGVEFSIFIGMFAGLANIIPYFGPIIGMIPAVAICLLNGEIFKAVLSVIILLVIQQIDGAIISPRIVGNSVGLHPVFVLLSVVIGGRYFGIIGMLLAVPFAAILKSLVLRFIEYQTTP
ncbi:MAG: AI-2E family transporter [Peptostreptococcales bacterium]